MSYTDWREQFFKKAEEDAEPEEQAETEQQEEAATDDTKTDDSSNAVIDMLRKILADDIVS